MPPAEAALTLASYLFRDLGFRGNQDDYYDPRNSFLNDVLERRTGIPISLSVLYLAWCPVTDEGLRLLAACPNLENLNVGASKVTDAGIADLKAALPNLKVER